MKNFILSGFSSFLVLFFLSLTAPALTGVSDANAQQTEFCSGVTTGTAVSGTTNAHSGNAGDDCELRGTTEELCETDTGCSWRTFVSGSADDNKFVDTICNILSIATGNGGKAFAAFAIISLGIGFFTGKVSWGLMIGVACGIAAMFGAPTIVAAISGEDAFSC